MDILNSYGVIISASLILVLSYVFNIFSKKTKVPSVLLLIGLGLGIKPLLNFLGIDPESINIMPVLELFGIVGLIMIVLEASIDLELRRDKTRLILTSFLIAIVSLGITSVSMAYLFTHYIECDLFTGFLYALPLSIMSSAIVIPSVENLAKDKKEFLIYESAFSDIIGIMVFYFLIQSAELQTAGEIVLNISGNITITLLISIIASYVLIYVFQNIKSETKLILLIAVLMILYSVGKMYHLSSLVMILFFGLVLKNPNIFFIGKLKRLLKPEQLNNIYKDFKIIIAESAFLVRTFFFVIFGFSIVLSSIADLSVLLVSLICLAIIYGSRWLLLKVTLKKNFIMETLMAPRGLITILLFYNIPTEYAVEEFETGILLLTIICTAIIMAVALIKFADKSPKEMLGAAKGGLAISDEEDDILDLEQEPQKE